MICLSHVLAHLQLVRQWAVNSTRIMLILTVHIKFVKNNNGNKETLSNYVTVVKKGLK